MANDAVASVSAKHSLAPSPGLRRRHRRERGFRMLCGGALLLAAGFLVTFLGSMVGAAWPALTQTEIKVEVDFTGPAWQAVDSELNPVVSRGVTRLLPMRLENNPELEGTVTEEWILAKAEIDQYLKGRGSLDAGVREQVEALRADGRVRSTFNHWLFTEGDSKLPEMAGLKSAIVGSIYVMAVTLGFAFPVGVLSAIYLQEFAPDNRFTQTVEININNLAAVPSIIFGLLGLAIIINFLGVPRSSALAGGLTLGLMTLPIIIISTRAALRAVPQSIRDGALAMGATRWQAVRDHVLPMSLPGILTGSIIGLAQAMGETAPLLMLGLVAYIPDVPQGFTDPATVMPAQIYSWASMPQSAFVDRTAAAILVLLVILIALNATAVYFRRRFQRRW